MASTNENIKLTEEENRILKEFEDLNLKVEELVRGETIDNVEEKLFNLCKTYMADHFRWKKFCKKVTDLEIRRISGGLTNQLYYVGLKNVEEPRQESDSVTVKFYQRKHMSDPDDDLSNERLSDLVISLMASERNIGPKIYGVLPDNSGIIQSYHEHEQFRIKHQQSDKLVRQLAHKLAMINNMNVPIEKTRMAFWKNIHRLILEGYPRMDLDKLAEEMNLDMLKEHNLIEEVNWYISFIEQYDKCPTVFCHNDFRGSNILVLKPELEKILVCDYEFGSYGLRGFDMASFLLEWNRDFFDFRNFQLPNDNVIGKFVKFYLEGCDLIEPGYSSRPENSCQQIIEEAKFGFLSVHVFVLGVMINTRETVIKGMPYNVRQQAQSLNLMYKHYLMIKDKLIKEKIIKKN